MIMKRDPLQTALYKITKQRVPVPYKLTLLQNPSSQQKIPTGVPSVHPSKIDTKKGYKMPTKQVIFAHFAVTPKKCPTKSQS
jgi:hypothetical protein